LSKRREPPRIEAVECWLAGVGTKEPSTPASWGAQMSNRRGAPDQWMAGGSFGEALVELQREGHINSRQLLAGVLFYRDMQKAHGTSQGIVMALTRGSVDCTFNPATVALPGGGGDPDAFRRMDHCLHKLKEHERAILAWLVKRKEHKRGSFSDLGRTFSNYRTLRTTKAVAIGRIGALLDTIGEVYDTVAPVYLLSSDRRRKGGDEVHASVAGLAASARSPGVSIRAAPS
jgi:hypothetical protein